VKAATGSSRFNEIKTILREHNLHTVCEEASCPNIGECFGKGTATFMIMGDKCTRRCPFCDVGHGRPDPLDADEPKNLARTIAALKLKYVVITSVDRDDLRDGGAAHFVECIRETRAQSPDTRIEILTPDFRGRLDRAISILNAAPPDVMNHNLETVPRLYKEARPGSDYAHSLKLLKDFKALHPDVATKSGLMVGLGETDEEILQVMRDLRAHDVDMLTIGQYLQPSEHHLPVRATCIRTPSRCTRKKRTRWASRTRPSARWCARAITPISRRMGPAWSERRVRIMRAPQVCAARHAVKPSPQRCGLVRFGVRYRHRLSAHADRRPCGCAIQSNAKQS
jgi:lipoic acid synthetase